MSIAEIIPGRLYFSPLETVPNDVNVHYFSVDEQLLYNAYHLDFGPLNLGCTYRFCQQLLAKQNSAKQQGMRIHYYCSTDAQKISNAMCLIGIYQQLVLDRTVEESYQSLKVFEPYMTHFLDASLNGTTFRLYPLHILQGVEAAIKHNWFNYKRFDVGEYIHYEQLEHGDQNVIINGKFLAFASPYDSRHAPHDYITFTPNAFIPIFRSMSVDTVVRLNDNLYDKRGFTSNSIAHHDQYFDDGSTPAPHIVDKFFNICKKTKGTIAIHCKAGLGRTGTLIALYMMQQYKVDAHTCIAWLRIARPGSVIGQQQHYLQKMQTAMFEYNNTNTNTMNNHTTNNGITRQSTKSSYQSHQYYNGLGTTSSTGNLRSTPIPQIVQRQFTTTQRGGHLTKSNIARNPTNRREASPERTRTQRLPRVALLGTQRQTEHIANSRNRSPSPQHLTSAMS